MCSAMASRGSVSVSPVTRTAGRRPSKTTSGPPRTQMALLAVPDQGWSTVEMIGTASGMFDLGLVVPEAGRLRRLTYEDVAIATGQKARVTFVVGGDNQYLLEIDDNGDGIPD